MLDILRDLQCDENGQGMVEYALVLGSLAVGVIAIMILALRYSVENLVSEVFNNLTKEIQKFLSASS